VSVTHVSRRERTIRLESMCREPADLRLADRCDVERAADIPPIRKPAVIRAAEARSKKRQPEREGECHMSSVGEQHTITLRLARTEFLGLSRSFYSSFSAPLQLRKDHVFQSVIRSDVFVRDECLKRRSSAVRV
jgi:hypothetical protein